MASQLDLDQGGINRQTHKVYLGPSVGWVEASWEWVLNVNLWGVIHGIEAFVPRLIEQGRTVSHARSLGARRAGIRCLCHGLLPLWPFGLARPVLATLFSNHGAKRTTSLPIYVSSARRYR